MDNDEFYKSLTDRILYSVKNNDEIWVSKDMIDANSEVVVGEHYCLNSDTNKIEIYEDQPLLNGKQLFMLLCVTFRNNFDKKWYQFWKPQRILDGYRFKVIDLKENVDED